ncbi:hypothetical protein [Vibrio aphrogenes]|uniref:hypothetical protein n=1 Tax=Vibrio aphrogenes TaxID=1891186 RepID=UPI000B351C97|nr:hypothetical protein [Vibrio aphrogenes]
MAKSLCKLSRRDIKAGNIEKLVVDAKFYCRSCARTSNQKNVLCHPSTLSNNARRVASQKTISTKVKNRHQSEQQAHNISQVVAKAKALKAQRDSLLHADAHIPAKIEVKADGVNVVTPLTLTAKPKAQIESIQPNALTSLSLNLKQVKVSLKAQKKQQKQLKKLLKKQRQAVKKHKKLLKQEHKLLKQETKLAKQQQKMSQREERIEKQLAKFARDSSFNITPLLKQPKPAIKALH